MTRPADRNTKTDKAETALPSPSDIDDQDVSGVAGKQSTLGQGRRARLKAALRKNLARRKAQARQRRQDLL